MKDNTEYQIFIGCCDSQLSDEIVSEDELKAMIVQFFKKKEIDFSVFSSKGGYLHADSSFAYENSLCINIIGSSDLDIIRLAKNLSMFMNQECSLVVKDIIKAELR
ncbi:MAG: hypothetical protein J6Y71_10810 [Ruminococcus sp.]|nr:hypothetical protein [Ruminococcus sp.]